MSEFKRVSQKSKIMHEALARIANHDAFFEGEQKVVEIARNALLEISRVGLEEKGYFVNCGVETKIE